MMTNLIERLDKLITVGNAKLDAVDWEWESTIQEAITALSPVLPDDVKLVLNGLVYDHESNIDNAADLLERQAREIWLLRKTSEERECEYKSCIADLESTITELRSKQG